MGFLPLDRGIRDFYSRELKLPQVTLVISLVGFLAVRLYSIHASGRSLRSAEAVAPSIFVSVVILVLVLFFSAGAGII